ncbi:MAG: hypothetical protein QOC72_666 [Methylobacteriaceae bacterium]|jgi:hypothetical protein|nr:hypothetical protein [Methylobacteriaceae bacterium]
MPVKFSYDPQFGLQIEPELDSELSRDEAMIVAVRDLASGMNSLGQAMWELFDEFRFKEFYKREEPAPERVSAAPAPPKRASAPAHRKATAPTRKKPPAAKSRKRRR